MNKNASLARSGSTARVIIAGRNYCSNLCLAKSVGEAGYEVEVLHVFQFRHQLGRLNRFIRPEAHSRYVKAFHALTAQKDPQKIFSKLLEIADPQKKMLLIPADDLIANIVDEHYDALSAHYLLPGVQGRQGALSELMGKSVQKALAREFGLPVAGSCVVRIEDGHFTLPEGIAYPCFIKPNVSKNGQKLRMQRCDDETALRAALSLDQNAEYLIEDYLDIEAEYSLLGVSCPQGAVAPGYFRAQEGGHGGRRGVALTGQVVPFGEDAPLLKEMARFVGSLGFTGLFDIDLIKTRDGKLYFVELNLRFGGSGFAITRSGVNLPGMHADYMLRGKPLDMACTLTDTGKTFVSEKILLEEFTDSLLSLRRMKAFMDCAQIHFIRDEQDMGPYRHFLRTFPLAVLKRIYKRLRRRQ